jgi:hypothetical protein
VTIFALIRLFTPRACAVILPPHLLMLDVQHVRVPRVRLWHGAPGHFGAFTPPFWQPQERQRSRVCATPRFHPALSRCHSPPTRGSAASPMHCNLLMLIVATCDV